MISDLDDGRWWGKVSEAEESQEAAYFQFAGTDVFGGVV